MPAQHYKKVELPVVRDTDNKASLTEIDSGFRINFHNAPGKLLMAVRTRGNSGRQGD